MPSEKAPAMESTTGLVPSKCQGSSGSCCGCRSRQLHSRVGHGLYPADLHPPGALQALVLGSGNSSSNIEFPSLNYDASAVLSEANEKTEPSLNTQEALAQLLPQQEASTHSTVFSELKFFSIIKELSSTSCASSQYTNFVNPWEGSTSTSKSSVDVDVQPSYQKATDSRPDWCEVQNRLLPICVKDVDLGVLITSEPPKKIEPSATSKASAHHAKGPALLNQPGKNPSLSWTEVEEKAFQKLKQALMSAPALALPDLTKPFQLYVAESQGVAKGVLTQTLGPWKRPIAYLSKWLDPVATGWPGCLKAIAATAILVKEASKLTFGQDLQVVAPHAVETLMHSPPEQTAAPTLNPEVTFPLPESVQAQQPTFPLMELEVPITPEPTLEAGATALQQTAAPPKHSEVTFPLQEPVQAQWPTFPPLDLGLTITPEPTLGNAATALQQTAAPPLNPGMTFPLPKPVQAQQPTFPPLELELPITPESTLEAGAAALQQNAAPAKHPEVTPPPPEAVQAQPPTFPSLDLELTITPEPTSEADATALQQTIAPPKHPEVTLQHPELVQPSFSEVTATVLSFDLEVTITQQPESSETVPPMTEQNATMNICELCSCNNGTLSCIGFGSNQRLHRVPVPEPSTYNGTFPVLNLQGNAISYISKDTEVIPFDSIERNAFESLPLLQYIILHNNPLMSLQDPYLFNFLHSDVECDSTRLASVAAQEKSKRVQRVNLPALARLAQLSMRLNLPAVKYLDMGTTQVTFTKLDNILMTTPELEKVILPNHLACRLCQSKRQSSCIVIPNV
ncbi:LOW QUALITY PROTEIN: hypothetical protein QTO34_009259 [Cnephaeus nilssonii]|uniref:Uncharacterized protein n=1 Tax=Cnephaeus nilssonii TaxID=3371016 RepID=A0AA40LGE2_CNENI|nr:LOW QUALITY PROTEIN: hypothetical protein QTO34_009259 [Eptesicus nilssonii]